ncbi:MAG: winged helix DNA-binding domain-containing protein [Proteobacteria bacterium]|nr:winged helix DNA-binding domain-containing protein [Pseudomonadota bacterium]
MSAKQALRLLLQAQGLLADPARRATPAAVYRQIERMGFVQLDAVNVVERAHHHVLMSRFDDYRPAVWTRLLERDRRLFEHWTHDASAIPTVWFRYWRRRFARLARGGPPPDSRWGARMEGDPARVIRHVLARIRREGPLTSADFEHDGEAPAGTFWRWKPQKTALEYLWRAGRLSVSHRSAFHKAYDLTERVFPELCRGRMPSRSEHCAWACRTGLERLGIGTAGEIARFFESVSPASAQEWCRTALRRREIVEVSVESADGSKPRTAYAPSDWEARMASAPPAPTRTRLLSPFDPTLRDRDRTRRLFGFNYTLECFVPATKRRYGYYVLPILEGDALVGRVDPKFHRDEGTLEIRGLWWEPGVRITRARRRALDDAIDRLATQIGAERWRISPAKRSR